MDEILAVALIAAAGAAAFFLPGASWAETSVVDQDTSDAPREADANPDTWGDGYVPWEADWPGATDAPDLASSGDFMTDLQAFKYMIRCCEHVYPRDVVNDACYQIFYGGQHFQNLADHPVITGECAPVPLPDHTCRAAGLGPGCVSTAAGAYQIIRPTWLRVQAAMGLPDFSKESQDAAADWLLNDCGALNEISAGNIPAAIAKASKLWASLPGSTAQQNPKKVNFAMARFSEGLTA